MQDERRRLTPSTGSGGKVWSGTGGLFERSLIVPCQNTNKRRYNIYAKKYKGTQYVYTVTKCPNIKNHTVM